mmetsp:Transcript_110451/g.246819  ORF Transcript_110451/g.246819 Transcript_110451/m.246819 type:complete len:691 (-) Transcript_110451:35-2107(-)
MHRDNSFSQLGAHIMYSSPQQPWGASGGGVADGVVADRLDMLEQELAQMKIASGQTTSRSLFEQQMASKMPFSQDPMLGQQMRLPPLQHQSLAPQGRETAQTQQELLKVHRELLATVQKQQEMMRKQHESMSKAQEELMGAHQDLLDKAMTAPVATAFTQAAGVQWSASGLPVIKNDPKAIEKPTEPTLMDNTLLFLPEKAVKELGLEPNMDDKGDQKKELWFGRVWELRALIAERYSRKLAGKRQETLTLKKKMELDQACNDPKSRKLLVKMAARWRGAAFRLRCGLAVLEKIRYCGLRGTLVYCHGSGGNSWDNMRICRMICKLGVLVIVPDGFAYPKNTPMGAMRHKDLLPLHKATDNVDYWEGDLMYCSDSSGDLAYSTKASAVLQDPKKFREMYERSYQLRRSELHFIIERLPHFIQVEGIFIGGTSEGAMTVTRFDDQRYGSMILGRFINSFSIEYCYFTPRPEDGRIGGQLEVPTLNIIGTKDQFFGPVDSVAKIVVMDKNTGYGDEVLDGNGYPCLVEQKVSCGLVCLFEDGVHSPCETHDNFLHPLFDVFFRRPHDIWRLNEIWKRSPRLKDLIQLAQSSVTHESKVVQVFCPKMKFPQKMSRQRVEELSQMKKGFTKQVSDLAAQEKAAFEKEQRDTQKMLDELRQQSRKQGGTGFETKLKKNKKGSFYDNDKPLTKAKE